MTDQEIAKNLKALVNGTSFMGSDNAKVSAMLQWLEDIEEGRKTVREPLKEVTDNAEAS